MLLSWFPCNIIFIHIWPVISNYICQQSGCCWGDFYVTSCCTPSHIICHLQLHLQAVQILLRWFPCNIIFVLPLHMTCHLRLHSQAVQLLLCWLLGNVIFVPLCKGMCSYIQMTKIYLILTNILHRALHMILVKRHMRGESEEGDNI